MAAKGKPGTPRRRRLSRPEVVAWIKDRQYQAVQLVWETLAAIARDTELAERKKPINWSLVHAIQDTRTPTWRIRGPNDSAAAAAAVARAEDELSAAEKDGRLLADANGLYSRVAVTKLFLALEGRGRKRQPRPYADRRKVEKLGQHMLAVRPGIPPRRQRRPRHPGVARGSLKDRHCRS